MVDVSVNALMQQRGNAMVVINPKKQRKKGRKYKGSGKLYLRSGQIITVPSLLDYIRGGCQISLMVAIDFTASNGNPASQSSLHYCDPTGMRPNQYQTAIRAIGSILQEYDSDKRFPVFGFGGKVGGRVSHCFNLGGGTEVQGVQGIEQAYLQALRGGQVSLSGPTVFHEIIDAASRASNPNEMSQNNQQYNVLLILTDGAIMARDEDSL